MPVLLALTMDPNNPNGSDDLNDPDNLKALQLTRYQYNALVLEQTYGPTMHDSICVEIPAPSTAEVLKQLEAIMNAPHVPPEAGVDFTTEAHMSNKPFEPLSVEAIEQLKQLGVLF